MDYIKSYSVTVDTMTSVLNNHAGRIHYKIGDVNTCQLTIVLTHNNTIMDVTEAIDILLVFEKPNGNVNTQDLSTGVSVVDASHGKIQVALNEESLSVSGQVFAEVHITFPDNRKLVTEKFSYTVDTTLLSRQKG